MSGLYRGVPSIEEIKFSLQRSRKVIEGSVRLTEKNSRMARRGTCNKCHLCSRGSCSRLSWCAKPFNENKRLRESHNSLSLRHQSEIIYSENLELTEKILRLQTEIDYLKAKAKYSDLTERTDIDFRIKFLENKIGDVESTCKTPFTSHTSIEKFQKVHEDMEKTDKKYSELQKKLDLAESIFLKKSYKKVPK